MNLLLFVSLKKGEGVNRDNNNEDDDENIYV